ncbi:MAG: hypothetical protein V4534_07170 [Myxococcota bacterium]
MLRMSLLLLLGIIACDPCWDKADNSEILKCMASYPVEDISPNTQLSGYLRDHKVYVSLTTSPQRISKLHWVLKSLDLTHVDTVFLALPAKYKNQESYTIPEDVRSFPKLKIIWRERDAGPIMKLIPAVEEVLKLGDPQARVITIDDDTVYAKGMIAQLLKLSTQINGVAALSGQTSDFFQIPGEHWPESTMPKPLVNIVEGFGGIAYPVGLIDVALMKQASQAGLKGVCKTSDDLVISWVLARGRVPRATIKNAFIPGVKQLPYGFLNDSLHSGAGCSGDSCYSNNERYKACAKALKELLL